MSLARWLLLGLEFMLAADIVRTVISPSWNDIGKLAAIAVIRTFLNFFLERDLEAAARSEAAPSIVRSGAVMTPVDPVPPQLPEDARRGDREQARRRHLVDQAVDLPHAALAGYRTHVSNLRSHLANERTHLAYLRTTVSLIGFGITINRFSIYLIQQGLARRRALDLMLRDTGNAGLGMVVLGLALLVWSIYRYWRVGADIERRPVHPAPAGHDRSPASGCCCSAA